ncbi:hypothetical protein ACWGQ5_12740 [Streptomyces sp. NPDC055722]
MDWKWTITAVLPVISLILGAWLTQLNDGRRDAAQLQREERAHTLERDRQRQDRREDFELTTLGELLTNIPLSPHWPLRSARTHQRQAARSHSGIKS